MKTLPWLSIAALLLSACAERVNEEPPEGSRAADVDEASPVSAAASGTVQLGPTEGNTASGMLALVTEGTGVRLTGTIQGLPPNGEFGFHVHETGDCSAPDASSAGPHFNPTGAQHGNPAGDAGRHAGDMANLRSDAQGVAKVDTILSGITVSNGQATDVMRRAVVVHEKADDYSSQPAGNSGARIACGVISG